MAQMVEGKGRQKPGKEGQDGMIGTFLRIISVLQSRWKLMLLLGLALSLVLVLLILLLPVQYSKRTNLAVTSSVSELQTRVGQVPLDVTQASNQAVSFLEQGDFGPVTVSPTYDPETQQVEVQAESENRRALAEIEERLVDTIEEGFAKTYEGSLGPAIVVQLSSANSEVETNRALLADIERQAEELQPVDPADTQAVVRLTVLESKRLDVLNGLAAAEATRNYFEGAKRDLPRLAAEPTLVKVANESAIQRNNQRLPAAAFAVFLSFVVAAAVALRVAARRRK